MPEHRPPGPPASTPFTRTLGGALAVVLAATLALPFGSVASSASSGLQAQQIPSPEAFFGHEMGADRELVGWDRLVEYYELIGDASDRVEVREVGPSTLGEPFLVLFVSSPENLANLERIRELNATLQDPRGHSEAEIETAIQDGKAVVVQSYGLHSTEVAGTQASAEITYLMATRSDPGWLEVLDNVVAIQIPSFNPDGTEIITDWYDRWVGTEWEGTGLPELYHHYIGHDNNRDAFMQNTVESRYGGRILFRDWIPQAYVDHHQMGSWGARMYVPPYAEPIRPEGDPLVWREMSWYGAHMAYGLEEEGREGIVNSAIYSGWGHFGFHWITPFHNIAGMLTESASARHATPLYVHPEQLRGSRQLPEYEEQTTFPNPWEGGWWRVRDIVINQRIATFELLDLAAEHRERVLRNAHLKARRQIERGMRGQPREYVIPAIQHDPLTARKMVGKLLDQGIDVREVTADFVHEGRAYAAGTRVVSMAQPKRGVIRWLLGRTFYPQNSYTRNPDGSPIRPYDMSADVLAEFMGVRVDPVSTEVEAPTTRVTDATPSAGSVARGEYGYRLDAAANDAFHAVNLLLDEDAAVRRLVRDDGPRPAGTFWVVDAPGAVVSRVAETTGVDFHPMEADPAAAAEPLRRLGIGMYQPYGGNMDEGWTRLLLEQFGFPYTTLDADAVAGGGLGDELDVVILPETSMSRMVGNPDADLPPGFRSGFGTEGVEALEAFVEGGGTLVTFSGAGELPIEGFDLPVRDIVDGVPSTEFWAYGSTLRVDVDTDHPLGLGMPDRAAVVFFGDSQVYEVVPTDRGEEITRVASYVDRDVLQSGQLDGEDLIAGKAAMLSVGHGEGRVVLIGFRTQHRAQTHGTYKFLFNALTGS